MKLKISLLVTAAFFTLVTVVAASLHPASETVSSAPGGLENPLPNPASLLGGESGSLALRPVHPDEPISETLNQRFSLNNSLERIQQVNQALSSFRQLTQKSQTQLTDSELQAIGNTDPETQGLGFPNWIGSVEGTLRKQNYEIKKLEYELAQKQYQDRQISKSELDQKAAAYQAATEEFQAFWSSFKIAD